MKIVGIICFGNWRSQPCGDCNYWNPEKFRRCHYVYGAWSFLISYAAKKKVNQEKKKQVQ